MSAPAALAGRRADLRRVEVRESRTASAEVSGAEPLYTAGGRAPIDPRAIHVTWGDVGYRRIVVRGPLIAGGGWRKRTVAWSDAPEWVRAFVGQHRPGWVR